MMLKFRFSAWQFLSVCLHFVIFEFTQSNYGFSCFVLFNFQGPVHWLVNQLSYYITLFSVCQHFFQIFSKPFFKRFVRFNVTTWLLYQIFFALSILFQNFFYFLLCIDFRIAVFSTALPLYYIIRHLSIPNLNFLFKSFWGLRS